METHDQRLALEESVVLEPARGGGGRGERCNYSSVNRERGGADQVRRVWLTSLPPSDFSDLFRGAAQEHRDLVDGV
jgi:hypothetical protein